MLPGSARLTVTIPASGSPASPSRSRPGRRSTTCWRPAPRSRCPTRASPPAARRPRPAPSAVFALDAEAGRAPLRRRPARAPAAAGGPAAGRLRLRRWAGPATSGRGAITSGPALPAGFSVANPVPTWGGADAETVAEGEKQVARYLQHRDRLVTGEDFATIARRTPGVELGRVEVLPAFDPELAPNLPGGAPGAVTLLLVPRARPGPPRTRPSPDRLLPRRRLPLPGPAAAGDDRAVPARPRLRADPGLGRDRGGPGGQHRRGPAAGRGRAAAGAVAPAAAGPAAAGRGRPAGQLPPRRRAGLAAAQAVWPARAADLRQPGSTASAPSTTPAGRGRPAPSRNGSG